jgi:hypothetical protein
MRVNERAGNELVAQDAARQKDTVQFPHRVTKLKHRGLAVQTADPQNIDALSLHSLAITQKQNFTGVVPAKRSYFPMKGWILFSVFAERLLERLNTIVVIV